MKIKQTITAMLLCFLTCSSLTHAYIKEVKERFHITPVFGKLLLNTASGSFLKSARNESATHTQYGLDIDYKLPFLGPFWANVESLKSYYNGTIDGKTSELRFGLRYYLPYDSDSILGFSAGFFKSKSEYKSKIALENGTFSSTRYTASTGGVYAKASVHKTFYKNTYFHGNVSYSGIFESSFNYAIMAGGLSVNIGVGSFF